MVPLAEMQQLILDVGVNHPMIPQKLAMKKRVKILQDKHLFKDGRLKVNRLKLGVWCVVLVVFFTGYWQSDSIELSLVMAGNACVLVLGLVYVWKVKGGPTVVQELLFCYGSLRQGEGNHDYLDGAEFITGEAWIEGTLYHTDFGYPAITLENRGRVYGEVYRITADILQKVDGLEQYYGEAAGDLNHYDRIRVSVHTDLGDVEAWTYIYPDRRAKALEPIPSGDWKLR